MRVLRSIRDNLDRRTQNVVGAFRPRVRFEYGGSTVDVILDESCRVGDKEVFAGLDPVEGHAWLLVEDDSRIMLQGTKPITVEELDPVEVSDYEINLSGPTREQR